MRRQKNYYPLETRILLDAAAATTAIDVAIKAEPVEPASSQTNVQSMDQLVSALAEVPLPQRSDEIAFIDGSIEDAEQLVENLSQTMEVVLIDANADGVAQITQVLDGRSNLSGVHIFSHGGTGQLLLGNTELTLNTLETNHQQAVSQWADALSASADILVYGCDLASGSEGQAFVDAFAELTQADIAASVDMTGNSALGGNWLLESEIGVVETNVAQLAGFQGLLTNAPTITDTGDTRQVAEDGILAISGITIADVDDGETQTVTIRVTDNSGSPSAGDLTGTLTLASTANLSNISGNGTGLLSFEPKFRS